MQSLRHDDGVFSKFKTKRARELSDLFNCLSIFHVIFFYNRHALELRESAEREEQKPVLSPGGEVRQIKITTPGATDSLVTKPTEEVEEQRTITAGNRPDST